MLEDKIDYIIFIYDEKVDGFICNKINENTWCI
jgi:hypothetical protein